VPDSDLHTVEWFVLGASAIMLVYHTILYLQQRDSYILLYSNYLLSLVVYLIFRRLTHYDTFENDTFSFAYIIDHPLILYMLFSYVFFISKVLEINQNAKVVKFAVYGFYASIIVLFALHILKILFTDETAMSRTYFLVSKLTLLFFAFTGLFGALYIRKTTFVRIIIAGGLVYAFFSLLTIFSIFGKLRILGLLEYDLYFIGCVLDILLFSTALGYRSYLINQEKVETQKLLTIESEKNKNLLETQHKILQKENDRKIAQAKMNRQLQDDVGASLSSLHIYADLAANMVESNPELTKEYLFKIASQGQQIMDDIGDIIWLANVHKEDIHDSFLSRIKNYSHEILVPHQIQLILKITPEFYEAYLSEDFLRSGLLMIKNKMKNIIHNQTHSELTIEITEGDMQPNINFK
jgi:signal transduction histidine kinase